MCVGEDESLVLNRFQLSGAASVISNPTHPSHGDANVWQLGFTWKNLRSRETVNNPRCSSNCSIVAINRDYSLLCRLSVPTGHRKNETSQFGIGIV